MCHDPQRRPATASAAAIALIREAAPDLALLDIRLEGKTGFDVAAYLRSLKLPEGADYWQGSTVVGTNSTVGGTQ